MGRKKAVNRAAIAKENRAAIAQKAASVWSRMIPISALVKAARKLLAFCS